MAECRENHHHTHDHKHGQNCGHPTVQHDGHTDYLHDGHMHHMHGDHVDEHSFGVDASTPDRCMPLQGCSAAGHKHGPNCGHAAVPHGNHADFLVDGRLHHMHGNHCDDHGKVA
jgi:hypothetical protein